MLWSIGNELSSQPGPVQTAYINAAVKLGQAARPDAARRPRGRRLPELALPGRPYTPLDVIGINDYFGWYPGPERRRSSTARSSPAYLDAVRACYPKQALMVTEFGAEANRDGPVEEKGT